MSATETEAKYTKGPWIAELGEVHEVRDAEGGRICILTQLRGRHGLGGRRPEHESPANARLIAAAPELLEALQGWLADYEGGKVEMGGENSLRSYAKIFRAAISKALGGTHA